MYRAIRPVLFAMDAERSHDLALSMLSTKLAPPTLKAWCGPAVKDEVTLLGKTFKNRVGLAAGLDKNARAIDAFGALGFGFIEVGTVTPKAQPGNEKPRLFRLPKKEALINRFGFNNDGVSALVDRVKSRKWNGVLGINIGKNASTPSEQALEDYVLCLQRVAPVADYITLNVSSPNTKNLRELQQGDALHQLLEQVTKARQLAAEQLSRNLPLLLKVAPDLTEAQRDDIAAATRDHHIDGIIASNTTVSRTSVEGLVHANQAGGLSGGPLRHLTPEIVSQWRERLGADKVLVAAGGIASGDDAAKAIQAGADLVQIYTGLIYQGPSLVRRAASAVKSQHPELSGDEKQ